MADVSGAGGRLPRGQVWVEGFVLFQLLCQVALVFDSVAPFRMMVRFAALASGVLLLLFLTGARAPHPSRSMALIVVALLGILVFHPGTAGIVAGAAHAILYIAILAPLFWVPRLELDVRVLRRVALMLWVFHAVGAATGVIQVWVPGALQPALSSVIADQGQGYVDGLRIMTSSGQLVFRPMGLTDVPGGAATHGLYAVVFGLGFFLVARSRLIIVPVAVSIILGTMCLYLAQVRALLVMTVIAVAVMSLVLAWRAELRRLMTAGLLLVVAGLWGLSSARDMAAPSVHERVQALVQQSPAQVYYQNRGHFLSEAVVEQLPRAPFGEGLGHWGMTAAYFGRYSEFSKPLWVEIQWAGWIVDGGGPLLIAYVLAILSALMMAWRCTAASPWSGGSTELRGWAVVVLAHGVAACALTFSYPVFVSSIGQEFWLLNALLFTAARQARASRASLAAEP